MILVTGAAGFIGSHLVERLLADGHRVTGIDSFDPFYARGLKEQNLAAIRPHPAFLFHEGDVCDPASLEQAAGIADEKIEAIVHLAAKANVRVSFAEPELFHEVNVNGTRRVLAFAEAHQVGRVILGSSSSIYGLNPRVPWSEEEIDLQPISPYAKTKLASERAGQELASNSSVRIVALRFFNVYGPRQRPDLAIAKFCRLLVAGEPLPFYGDGSTGRDYTFIDDIVDGIVRTLRFEGGNFEVFNFGNHHPVSLTELVTAIGTTFGIEPRLDYQPEQPGDVPKTWARIEKAERLLNWRPHTRLADGLQRYRSWLTDTAPRVRAPL